MTVNPDIPPPKPKNPVNYVILGLLVLAYLFNSDVAEMAFPDAKTSYNEWIKYYELRNKIYEVVFFLMFLFAFLNTRGLLKAISAFAMAVSCASVIDKIFLNITEFIWTDWAVITFGVMAGIYVYLRQK